MLSAFLLSLSLTAALQSPAAAADRLGADFLQPAPLRSEQPGEFSRRLAWEAYCRDRDRLEREYREAGATPAAWKRYQAHIKRLRMYYLFDDLFVTPALGP